MPDWDKTINGIRRLQNQRPGEIQERIVRGQKLYYFRNRLIIGHDTPINGGVYVGETNREAIVVADKEQPLLHKVYWDFVRKHGRDPKLLSRVFEYVRKVMPPKLGALEAIKYMQAGNPPDSELPLERLIHVGGVCRHLPLLIGYILERMIAEGKVYGRISIDRNYIQDEGGHAWARFTDRKGRVAILDPVIIEGGFKGYIHEIKKLSSVPWYYLRKEDL